MSHERPRLGARLTELSEGLSKLAASSGRTIRVALESEPGCVVETIEQACAEFAALDHDWLGVCLDVCHLAVQFEDPWSRWPAWRPRGCPW